MTPAKANSLAVFSSYNFSASGPGTFIFDPVSTFQVIGLNDSCETTFGATRINATNAGSVSITVTDVSKREIKLEKRRKVECGTSTKSSFISDSVKEATHMATQAVAYIKAHGDGDSLYMSYFRHNSISDVIANFNKIVNEDALPGTMSCSDPDNACSSDNPAYKQPAGDHFNIYYCDQFYQLDHTDSLCTNPNVSDLKIRGSRALSVLAYALSSNMRKLVEGCDDDTMSLSADDMIRNPDNYMVSTQILRYLPRARVLTRAVTFIVLRHRGLQAGRL